MEGRYTVFRSPYKLAFGTYSGVLFAYWGVCRYNYRLLNNEYFYFLYNSFNGEKKRYFRSIPLHMKIQTLKHMCKLFQKGGNISCTLYSPA